MIYKAEVLTLPFQAERTDFKSNFRYLAASVHTFPKSGELLIADVQDGSKDRRRIVMSKTNHQIYCYNTDKWGGGLSVGGGYNSFYYANFLYAPGTKEAVKNYFGKGSRPPEFVIHEVVTEKVHDRYWRQKESREHTMNEWLKKAPQITPEIYDYYAKRSLSCYIFIGKVEDGSRPAKCSFCGAKFKVDKAVKHKTPVRCPECGVDAIYFKEQYYTSLTETTTAIRLTGYEDATLYTGHSITRGWSSDGKPQFSSYLEHMLIRSPSFNKSYTLKTAPFSYDGWKFREDGYGHHYEGFVYGPDLDDKFPEIRVNLSKVFHCYNGAINFERLAYNLARFPQTEYLIKMGLIRYASEFNEYDAAAIKSAKDLHLSKPMIRFCAENDCSTKEIRLVRQVGGMTKEELKTIRRFSYYAQDILEEIIDRVSITKALNYLAKQQVLYPKEAESHILQWWKDYFNLADELGLKITKSEKTPKDIKKIHDELLLKAIAIRSKEEKEAFRYAIKTLYTRQMNYADEKYCIVLPTCREDFVREGNELHHCVGGQEYFDKHKSGAKMVFFIRRRENIDKPFVTIQVDMKHQKLLQCYGFNDTVPDKEIREFALKFVDRLKKHSRREQAA